MKINQKKDNLKKYETNKYVFFSGCCYIKTIRFSKQCTHKQHLRNEKEKLTLLKEIVWKVLLVKF